MEMQQCTQIAADHSGIIGYTRPSYADPDRDPLPPVGKWLIDDELQYYYIIVLIDAETNRRRWVLSAPALRKRHPALPEEPGWYEYSHELMKKLAATMA